MSLSEFKLLALELMSEPRFIERGNFKVLEQKEGLANETSAHESQALSPLP